MSGSSRRGLLMPTLATFAALMVLVGLGSWQLERLSWKNGLIAQVETRAAQPPHAVLPASQWPSVSRELDEYQPVRATGTFDHGKETLIYTVLSDPKGSFKGPGFQVLTPLMLPDGSAILVNRGFVPEDRRAPESRREGQVQGTVTVTGLLRMPEEASWFVPANDPAHNAWFRRDPAEIASARGLAKVAPFIIDADASANPGGLPQGGETRLTFPNRHLEYALTWYGLAVTLAGVYVAFVFSRRRGLL
ncbi:SURF1 family protein [Roseixanthobacter glucoisosaccharinicivorans]|uniref:SURF1 family protein n=1 Tax=Roseixanthobacter glucoisosaccharinicivorans TaxID=3119923 RepID=UPI003726D9F0